MMNYFSSKKKFMAYLILLTFVFTCIVPSNLVGGNSAWADTVVDNQQQIVSNTGGLNPEDGTLNADGVSVSKTITPTEDENYFDITLQVNVEEDTGSITKPADAAVVLVLDVSGSMQWDINSQGVCMVDGCANYGKTVPAEGLDTCAWYHYWGGSGSTSRFQLMSDSLTKFMDAFYLDEWTERWTGENQVKRLVSVVEFGDSNIADGDWHYEADSLIGSKAIESNYDNSTGQGITKTGWINLGNDKTPAKTAVSFNRLKDVVSNQTAQGIGLNDALTLLDNEALEGIDNKYVILLTDGRPEGNHGEEDFPNINGAHAEKYANLIKDKGVNLYTIGFGTSSFRLLDAHYTGKTDKEEKNLAVNSWMSNYLASRPIGVTGDPYIENPDGNPYFKSITATTSLASALGDITKNINSASVAEPKTVTDKMGENVEFIGFCDGENIVEQLGAQGEIATASNGIITWQVPESVDLDNADNKQMYKITYRVRLKTEAGTFDDINQEQQYIAHLTNEFAKLVYDSVSKEDDVEISRVRDKEIAFPSPAVNGYRADLSFQKVDSFTNESVNGATFTLAHASDCAVCTSAGIDNVQISMTATSGANGIKGQVDFTNIPSGHEYTLTETAAPTGHALNEATYTVTVSYGELTSDIRKDSQGNLYITNDRTGKITVEGTKTWVDGSNEDNTRPTDITLKLYRYTTYENSKEQVAGVIPIWTKSGNVWRYQFTGLDQYVKINDRQYEYTYVVEEVPVNGYEKPVYSGDKKYDITNTLSQKYITVEGEKIWEDGNKNHDGNKPIILELFRDGRFINTTKTALDWSYSFGEQPKYALESAGLATGEKADGHVFEYQVREQEIPAGYIPDYNVEVKANGDYYITITNNVRDEKTPINILGKKIWTDGNDKHNAETEKVEIQLFRSDMPEEAWKTTKTALDWTYSFTDLPKYNDNNEWITYTVKEVPVEGYISAVVPTADGFDIVNTPYVENQGQIAVGKVVTTEDGATPPQAGTEFEFLLKIKAELDQREFDKTVAKEEAALKEAYEKAVIARNRAAIALNGSDDGTEQGAVGKFKANAFMTTPSQYQFIMVGKDNDAYYAATTSPSAYVYSLNGETVEKQGAADTTVLGSVLKAIEELAKNFSSLYNETSFLHQLTEKAEGTTPSALAFRLSDASELLEAHNAYNAADKLVTDTFNAWDNYNVTTPTAIKVFWKDGNDVTEIKKDIADLVDGWYHIGFKLLDKEVNSFEVEATTGSMITFFVTETGYAQADATEITVKDGDVTEKTISGRFTDLWNLTTESAYGFTFNNIYKPQGGGGGGEIPTTISRTVEKVWNDNGNPNRPTSITVNLLRNGEVVETVTLSAANGWDYSWDNLDASYVWSVQEVNVAEGYTASVAKSGNTFTITNTLTTTSTIPEETIPDDNVPTGTVEVPGESLDDPEIPLGDAPATGDTNNAAPFMALMLFAVAGLVITRRKFN